MRRELFCPSLYPTPIPPSLDLREISDRTSGVLWEWQEVRREWRVMWGRGLLGQKTKEEKIVCKSSIQGVRKNKVSTTVTRPGIWLLLYKFRNKNKKRINQSEGPPRESKVGLRTHSPDFVFTYHLRLPNKGPAVVCVPSVLPVYNGLIQGIPPSNPTQPPPVSWRESHRFFNR